MNLTNKYNAYYKSYIRNIYKKMGLEKMRNSIDIIDNEILRLIWERNKVVSEIAAYKKIHNMDALQPTRWTKLLNSLKNRWLELWIDSVLVEEIWEAIHKNSLTNQKKMI